MPLSNKKREKSLKNRRFGRFSGEKPGEEDPAYRAEGAKMNAVHKAGGALLVQNAEKLTNGQKCLSMGLTNGHFCATLQDDK